jgi:hypothetical protein
MQELLLFGAINAQASLHAAPSHLSSCQQHVTDVQVMEALEIAARWSLDTDPMFKALWEASQKTVADVEHTLAPMKDKDWVLGEILGGGIQDLAALQAACRYDVSSRVAL